MLRIPWLEKAPAEAYVGTVDAFVEAYKAAQKGETWMGGLGLRKFAEADPTTFATLVARQGEDRGRMAIALLRKAKSLRPADYVDREYWIRQDLIQLAGRLVSAKGAVALDRFPAFVAAWLGAAEYGQSYARIAALAEEFVAAHGGLPIEVEEGLRAVLTECGRRHEQWGTAETRRQIERIQRIMDPNAVEPMSLPEPWQAPFRGPEWAGLVKQAALAKPPAMTEKWAQQARPLLESVGQDRFLETFAVALDAVSRMPEIVPTGHSDMLRGLAWFAGLAGTPRAATLLGRLALASAHKLPGVGARSQKGFSGAVGALERMGTFESLAELSNARNRIKAGTLNAVVVAALDRAARKQELPLDELEELVVPTYGLELPGVRRESLGTVEARLQIVGTTDVELRWFRDGKELKSPPAEAKGEHAETLKELKTAKKEIEAALGAQRARIEGLMTTGRTVPYAQWRERYLDHPLLANLVRRLVWRFAGPEGERLGLASQGEPLDAEGTPLDGLGEGTTVRLWHPLDAGLGAIETWRESLIAREIRQPFKQAYREIYLLTAAEERTNTYSNRFAAHVLKQHQMAALARGRGWRYALQGYFDSDSNPTLDLSRWGLEAEYFVEVPDMGALPDDETMTESGIAVYVVTDQVRFLDVRTRQPVALDTVPPVVLSETLRDVDLFVGVASVGNDPGWSDQGERAGYGGYWRQVSFGDLSATAETRRAVLERLLPRLALGKVARIDGKFLVVTGKRRTYKIHLGSGNILMEPNDQYLCIVPGSLKAATSERVFLPFEGDGVLAIILSKAALLAKDDLITDPTIVRQL